jgi:hypothetical protein
MPTPISPDHTPRRHVFAEFAFTSSVALLGAFFFLALSLESEGECQTESDYAAHAALLAARQSASDCSAPDVDWQGGEKDFYLYRNNEIPIRIPTETRAAILNRLANAHAPCSIVPAFKNGRAYGFKIFGVRDESPLRDLGFENGDVVTRIGTFEITSPESALEAYNQLLQAEAITVTIERRGVESTRAYVLKDDACADGRPVRDFVRATVAED